MMRPTVDHGFETTLMNDGVPDAGLYTWDIPENVLYADSALAALFGLDADLAEKGLPIEVYLERVHPEDRPRLARTIRDSIVGHRPQQETYRVLSLTGSYMSVASYGRGFRNAAGSPIRYVGIVIPALTDTPETSH